MRPYKHKQCITSASETLFKEMRRLNVFRANMNDHKQPPARYDSTACSSPIASSHTSARPASRNHPGGYFACECAYCQRKTSRTS